MQEIVQAITSLFEREKEENNYMVSDVNDLKEETNDLISDIKIDISTLKNKVDNLNVTSSLIILIMERT